MEFSVLGGLAAGLLGTAVMFTMMKMAGRMGMTDMPPMELVIGSTMSGDRDRAMQVGAMVHGRHRLGRGARGSRRTVDPC